MAKLGVTLKPITLSWKAAVDRALGCCNIDDHHQRPPDPAPHEFESDKSNLKHSLRRLHHHLTHNHHNHRCTASSSNSPTMDPKLWSNLPIHLLERILALLPVPSLLRLRSVSKQFNELLQSPTLFATVVSTRRHSSSQQPWYLFRGEGRECVAFNPELDSWCKLPLGFLPSSKARVVAAAAGLLCLRHRDDKMFVCNPLSKAWVELPPKRHLWRYPIVGGHIKTHRHFFLLPRLPHANFVDVHASFVHCWYVGVIRFVFHVLQLLPIRFTEQNLCCIGKSTMKYQQKWD